MSHYNSPKKGGASPTNGSSSQTSSSTNNWSNLVNDHRVIAQSSDDVPGSHRMVPTAVRNFPMTHFEDSSVPSVSDAASDRRSQPTVTSRPAAEAASDRRSQPAVSTPSTTSGTNQSRSVYPAESTNIYRFEINRLNSFKNDWPSDTPVTPEGLAAAGFYWLGVGDCVRCAFCQGTLKQWEAGDDPLVEHERLFPRCPFIVGANVDNVPMSKKGPVLESFPVEFRQIRDTPYRPEYSDYARRLQTFHGGRRVGPSAEQLARCGFYSLGQGDAVACFWCGGSLKQWNEQDQAWSEHARWFPHCVFIRQTPKVPASMNNVSSSAAVSNLPAQFSNQLRVEDQHAEMQWSETSQTTTAPSETITNPAPIPLFVTLLEDDQPANETNESGTVSETEKNFDVTRGPNEQSRDTVQLQMNSKSSDISAALPPEAHRKRVAELQNLQEENRRLKDAIVCKICMENEVNTLFLPCGHLASCDKCALSLVKCPMCRGDIRGTIRTYL